MATDIVGSWERVSFYYAREAAWSGEKVGDYFKIRESSVCWPYSTKPIIAPAGGMGSGLPYDDIANFQLGRDGLAFPSRHPMTVVALRDLLALFFQGAEYGTVGAACFLSPLAETTNAVVWKAQEVLFATVVCINDGGAGSSSQLQGSSCLLSGIDLTFPQNTPGETGGQCEIGCSWIGEQGNFGTAFTINDPAAPTADTGAVLLTSGWDFKIASTAYNFLNASISLTNMAALDAGAGSAFATGATIGKLGATGSITMYLDQDGSAPGSGCNILLAALELKSQVILHFRYWVDPNTLFDIEIPAVINMPGEPTDLGGIAVMTFPFQAAGDADSPIRVEVRALDVSTFSDITV